MISISCLESKLLNNNNWYGRFQLAPFQKGEGLTVANALRRTLLAEKSNFFITWVDFYNAEIPYSVLTGMRESIFDILLNLKQVIFTSDKSIPNSNHCFKSPPSMQENRVKFFSKNKLKLESKINSTFTKNLKLHSIRDNMNKRVMQIDKNFIISQDIYHKIFSRSKSYNNYPVSAKNSHIVYPPGVDDGRNGFLRRNPFGLNKFRYVPMINKNISTSVSPLTSQIKHRDAEEKLERLNQKVDVFNRLYGSDKSINKILPIKKKNQTSVKGEKKSFRIDQNRGTQKQNVVCKNQILGKIISRTKSNHKVSSLLQLGILQRSGGDDKLKDFSDTSNSKNIGDSTYIGYICAKGPTIIYAKNIKLPLGLKCVDPDKYIVTLADDGLFYLRFALTTPIKTPRLKDSSKISININQGIKFNNVKLNTFPKILFNNEIPWCLSFHDNNLKVVSNLPNKEKKIRQNVKMLPPGRSIPIINRNRSPRRAVRIGFSLKKWGKTDQKSLNNPHKGGINQIQPINNSKNLIKQQRLLLTNDSIKQFNFQNISIIGNLQKTCLLNIQIKHNYYKCGRFDRFLFDLIKPFKPILKSTYYNNCYLKRRWPVGKENIDFQLKDGSDHYQNAVLTDFNSIVAGLKSSSVLYLNPNCYDATKSKTPSYFSRLVIIDNKFKNHLIHLKFNYSSPKRTPVTQGILKKKIPQEKRHCVDQLFNKLSPKNKISAFRRESFPPLAEMIPRMLPRAKARGSIQRSVYSPLWESRFSNSNLYSLKNDSPKNKYFGLSLLKWQKIFKSLKTNSIYDYFKKLNTNQPYSLWTIYKNTEKFFDFVGSRDVLQEPRPVQFWLYPGFQSLRENHIWGSTPSFLRAGKFYILQYNNPFNFQKKSVNDLLLPPCKDFNGLFSRFWLRPPHQKSGNLQLVSDSRTHFSREAYQNEKAQRLSNNRLWESYGPERILSSSFKSYKDRRPKSDYNLREFYYLKLIIKNTMINNLMNLTRAIDTSVYSLTPSKTYRLRNSERKDLQLLRTKPSKYFQQLSYKPIWVFPSQFQQNAPAWLNYVNGGNFAQASTSTGHTSRPKKKIPTKPDQIITNNVVLKPIYLNIEQIIYILKQTTRFQKNQRINPRFFNFISKPLYPSLHKNNSFSEDFYPLQKRTQMSKKTRVNIWIFASRFVFFTKANYPRVKPLFLRWVKITPFSNYFTLKNPMDYFYYNSKLFYIPLTLAFSFCKPETRWCQNSPNQQPSKRDYSGREGLFFPQLSVNFKPENNYCYNEPYNINIYNSKICFNLRYTYPFKYTIFETLLPYINSSEKIWSPLKNSHLASLAKNGNGRNKSIIHSSYSNFDFIQYNESFKIYTNLPYTCLKTYELKEPKYHNFDRRKQKKSQNPSGTNSLNRELINVSKFLLPILKRESNLPKASSFDKNKDLLDKISKIFLGRDLSTRKLGRNLEIIKLSNSFSIQKVLPKEIWKLIFERLVFRFELSRVFNSISKWRIMNNLNFNDAFINIPCFWSSFLKDTHREGEVYSRLYVSPNRINWFYSFVPQNFFDNTIFLNSPSLLLQNLDDFTQEIFWNTNENKQTYDFFYKTKEIIKNKLNWSKTTSMNNKYISLEWFEKNFFWGGVNSKNKTYAIKSHIFFSPLRGEKIWTKSSAPAGNKPFRDFQPFRPPLEMSGVGVPKSKIATAWRSFHQLAVNFENIYYKNFLWNSRKITLRILNNAVLPLVTNRKYSILNFVQKKNYLPRNFNNLYLLRNVYFKPKFSSYQKLNRYLSFMTGVSYKHTNNYPINPEKMDKTAKRRINKKFIFSNPFSEIYYYQKLSFYSVRHKTLNFICCKQYPVFNSESQMQSLKRPRNFRSYSNSEISSETTEPTNEWSQFAPFQQNGIFSTTTSLIWPPPFSYLRAKWRPFFNGSRHFQDGETDFSSPFLYFKTGDLYKERQSENNPKNDYANAYTPSALAYDSRSARQNESISAGFGRSDLDSQDYLLSYNQVTPEKLASFRKNKWIERLIQGSKFPRKTDSNNISSSRMKQVESPLNTNLWSSLFFCNYSLYAISTKSDLFLQNLMDLSSLTNQTHFSQTVSGETQPWNGTLLENTEFHNGWIQNTKQIGKNLNRPFTFNKIQFPYEQNHVNSFVTIKPSIKSYERTIQNILKPRKKRNYQIINYPFLEGPSYNYNWQKTIQSAIIHNLNGVKSTLKISMFNSYQNQYAVKRLKKYYLSFGNPLRRHISEKSLSLYNIISAIKYAPKKQQGLTGNNLVDTNPSLRDFIKSWKSIICATEANIYFCFHYPKFIQNCNRINFYEKRHFVDKPVSTSEKQNVNLLAEIIPRNAFWGFSVDPQIILTHWLNRINIYSKLQFKWTYWTYLSKSIISNQQPDNRFLINYTQLSSNSNKTHYDLSYNKIPENIPLTRGMHIQNKESCGRVNYFTINEGGGLESLNSIYKVNYIVESHVSESKPISESTFPHQNRMFYDNLNQNLELINGTGYRPENNIKKFENIQRNSATIDSLTISNFLNATYSFVPSKTIMVNSFNELINFPINKFQVENENEYIQIDIWTNGEITPRQALLNAFKKLFELFYNLSKYNCLKPIEI